MIKKISALILFAILTFQVVFSAGCANNNKDKDSADKTILTVGVFDAGLGTEWLYQLKKRFEKEYADYSFEEGKLGVSIKPVPARSFTQTGMENNMDEITEDVIFAEGANALYFAEKGNFLDITDMVNSSFNYDLVRKTVNPALENVTLLSKLNEVQKNYFSYIDDKYYALPTAETHYGIAYDIEFFEENGLYFNQNGNFIQGNEPKGTGPDGKTGTFDDGLPATYEQFFRLCDKIALIDGTIPVMWGGAVQEYVSSLLTSLAADYDGVEQAELNYNYSGTLRNPIVGFNNGIPVLGEDITITAQTGYNMYKQAGKYYALKFLEQLVSKQTRYNYKNATTMLFTHQDAEGTFISGKYIKGIDRVAMLIDGVWWQNEAKGTFNDLAAEFGKEASIKERKFGYMPLPKVDESKLGESTVLNITGNIGFINARCPSYKHNLAKAFLRYCFTDESCVEYVLTTNVCRPVSFNEGESYNDLSTWGKTIVDIHNNSVKAYQDSTSKIFRNYSVDLWYQDFLWLSKVSGTSYVYPSKAMIDDKITAEQYFNGLSAYWTPTVWANKFKAV